jgi:enoyl-CoA hydratase/carnithine racemase
MTPVLFEEIRTAEGLKVGHATLNKPAALNALDIDMIRLLMPQLLAWQQDPEVVCVLLDGQGEKAFCAGGDVVAMHNAMKAQPATIPASLQAFFTEEYQLDYLIHSYGKPFVLWGNGIVMGGGLGLMAGASHRIVTASSRVAMPEISIGLYPDVGGSWFLNQMPGGCGLFLGLTGASINASDCLYLGLADYFIPHPQKSSFMDRLIELNWHDEQALEQLCLSMHIQHKGEQPPANIKAHQGLIDSVTTERDVVAVIEQILSLDAGDDKWISKAQSTLLTGSAISAHLVFEQLVRGKSLTLAECFRMELGMSCRCGEFGEFQEGVRALLVDKDSQPKWRYRMAEDVPAAIIEHFFSSPWEGAQHPLAGLEQQS